MTIIYVTHDPLEMAALADRVAVVEHGSLVQAGSLSELSDDPRSLFIAQHVTLLPLNVASGTLINHGGRWSVDLKVGVYELQGTPNGATTGQPISWLLDPRSSRASAGTHHMVSRVVDTLGVRLARLNGDPPLWCAVDDAIQAGIPRSMSPSTSKGFGFLRSQEQRIRRLNERLYNRAVSETGRTTVGLRGACWTYHSRSRALRPFRRQRRPFPARSSRALSSDGSAGVHPSGPQKPGDGLQAAIAHAHDLAVESVAIDAGSSPLINRAIRLAVRGPGEVIMLAPTYSEYEAEVRRQGAVAVNVCLRPSLGSLRALNRSPRA